MSEAQHTPGPWRYVHEPGYCGELIAQDGTTIAEFVVEPSLDNARLIAAAPELLEALQALVNEPQPLGIDSTAYQAALVAITKATGGAA